MAKREELLAKNTLLFALGNLGSKLLQIFLVPFYTRFMTEAQYGTVDMLQAIVSLLIPVLSLTIYESVFRFAMESEYDKNAVLSVGLKVTGIGTAACCLVGVTVSAWVSAKLVWLVIANTAVNGLRTLLSQYTKAIGRTGLFTLDNVLMTAMVLIFNITLIAGFHMGISGYMLGYILANLLSCVFLFLMLGKQCRTRPRTVSKGLTREMLAFSLPLMPNGICWWISSFLDRIMIVAIVGAAANGLYAAAHKLPSLLSVVVTIFFQAWQVSANQEFQKKDISQFYSNIFRQISSCLVVLSSLLILLCRPINSIFLGADYQEAWLYMPPLVLSTLFFSFGQFLGSVYSANKKTKMALVTNAIAVAVSISLNVVLIPLLGTLGACIANACSYLVLWLVRIWDTGKIVPIQYAPKKLIASIAILLGQVILVCLALDVIITYALCTLGTVALVILHGRNMMEIGKFYLQMAGKMIKRS